MRGSKTSAHQVETVIKFVLLMLQAVGSVRGELSAMTSTIDAYYSGYSVAMTAQFIVVGSGYDVSVYAYNSNSDTWSISQTLTASDFNDDFGYSVAISKSSKYIIAGTRTSGKAYIFTLNSGDDTFTETEIIDTDTYRYSASSVTDCGDSAAISNNWAIICNYKKSSSDYFGGGCYVYFRERDDWWLYKQTLKPTHQVETDTYFSL